MKNKQTILITGATGNIGGGAAVALFGCRLETLETRADSIRTALSEALIEYQDKDIDTMVVDFSDMRKLSLNFMLPGIRTLLTLNNTNCLISKPENYSNENIQNIHFHDDIACISSI